MALPLDPNALPILWSLNQATLNGIARFVNQTTSGSWQFFNLDTLLNGTASVVFNYGTSGNVSQTVNLTLFNVSTQQMQVSASKAFSLSASVALSLLLLFSVAF